MRVQVTVDKKGVSVWPIDTILKYDDNEWYDINCKTRGTNGLQDWESLERMIGRDLLDENDRSDKTISKRYLLDITEIKENGSMP